MSTLTHNIKLELLQIKRDPMLPWMMLFPVVLALLARFVLPSLQNWSMDNHQYDLMQFAQLGQSILVLTAPLVIGLVIGFLLLDQKDENSLIAIALTPASLTGYLLKKMVGPLLIAIPITLFSLWISQLVPFNFLRDLLVTLISLLLAPCFGLFLAVLASNKVQGLALSKISGLFLIPPILGWVYQNQWGWLGGFMPTYWPCYVFWHFESGLSFGFIGGLIIAIVYPVLIVMAFLKVFMKLK